MTTTYPVSYGTQTVTLERMIERYQKGMQPEYKRRLFAFLESKGGHLGIGSAWRTKPHPVSQASMRGHSFHQDQRWDDGQTWFAAVDLVARAGPGENHRSPNPSEVPLQGSAEAQRWGLHINIDGEPWHMQPIETDGWQSWSRHRRSPQPNYPIPDGASVPVVKEPVPSSWPSFAPDYGAYSLWPFNPNKQTVRADISAPPADIVEYLQGVFLNNLRLSIIVDGMFGPKTEAFVRQVQGWNSNWLEQDGIVGRKTWAVIDRYAGL